MVGPPQTPKPPAPAQFPSKVYLEFKRLIAVECLTKFSANDMKNADQEKQLFKYYHGQGDVVSQTSKLMSGMSPYTELWETVVTDSGTQVIIPEKLHRQMGKTLVRGKNITEVYIQNTYVSRSGLISGRTGRGYAQEATREAKKMLSLVGVAVRDGILEKDGNNYIYPSGKKEVDFINFILFNMYNWSKLYGATGGGEGEEVLGEDSEEGAMDAARGAEEEEGAAEVS